MPAAADDFRSVERRDPDRSIVTEQTMTTARPIVSFSDEGARTLGRRYWLEVTRASRRLLRYRATGGGLELKVLGVGPALIRVAAVEITANRDYVKAMYRVRGGLLALGEGGTLSISQTAGQTIELRVAVQGFLARGGPIYVLQRRLHVAISRRFFQRLLSEGAA